jgi:hypothetical protein
MRVRSIQARPAGLNVMVQAGALALVLAAAAACSAGPTPGSALPASSGLPSTSTPSPSGTPSSAAAPTTTDSAPTYDASSAMAQKLQQTGCKAALTPLFTSVVNGVYPRDRVEAATPAAAQPAMKQSLDTYAQILSEDPNAASDGNSGKAVAPISAFCLTPAGAALVGTTPVQALKPVKPPKPTTHHA